MANWCENIFIVKGERKELKSFKSLFSGYPAKWDDGYERGQIKEKKPCFNALYPVPDQVVNQGYSEAGYEWCINHWGVKADIYDMDIGIREENFLEYCFDTPWNPPLKWVEFVSRLFPTLEFEIIYQEDGMCFCGKAVFVDGEEVESEFYQYGEEAYIHFLKKYFGKETVEMILEGLE